MTAKSQGSRRSRYLGSQHLRSAVHDQHAPSRVAWQSGVPGRRSSALPSPRAREGLGPPLAPRAPTSSCAHARLEGPIDLPRVRARRRVLFQKPTARPARNAAPSAVVSMTFGRTTGTPRMSAWNCISRLLAAAPPSTRSSSRFDARVLLHHVENVRHLERDAFERRAREVRRGRAPRDARDEAPWRTGPSAARRGRRTPARDTRRRRRAPTRPAASTSAEDLMRPSPSRSHWTTAPPMKTLPSRA